TASARSDAALLVARASDPLLSDRVRFTRRTVSLFHERTFRLATPPTGFRSLLCAPAIARYRPCLLGERSKTRRYYEAAKYWCRLDAGSRIAWLRCSRPGGEIRRCRNRRRAAGRTRRGRACTSGRLYLRARALRMERVRLCMDGWSVHPAPRRS